jgi:membrane-associated protein
LFVVIFCETGLVVTPFLPGDSLIFAAGAFAALGSLDPFVLFVLLSAAAIAGDTVNYWAGHYIGPKAFSGNIRFLKKEHLERTHRFYERYGGKTIVIARFIPIIRTFAPFVAGIGAMNYTRFIVYNIAGGVAWVGLFVFGGYFATKFLADKLDIKTIFPWIIVAIIFISVMPILFEYFRARRKKPEDNNP